MKGRQCVLAVVVMLGCFAMFPTDLVAGKPPKPPADLVPPAAVLDLTATCTEPYPYSVELPFTATGDDGVDGQAARYDLRYATTPIVEATWSSARQAYGEPAPQPAGTSETLRVDGLNPATTYYFALKVVDEANNISNLSNVPVSTTTQEPPSPWTTEVVDTTGGGGALDFHGGPGPFTAGCAHQDGDGIFAVLWDGSQWQREYVTTMRGGGGIDFAFAPDGTPTVTFVAGRVKFARRTGTGTWAVDTVENAGTYGTDSSLAYDPSTGEPSVAFRHEPNLRFARKVGGLNGTWQVETVTPAMATQSELVYDGVGRPVIAYYDADPSLGELKVATKVGSTWQVVAVDSGESTVGIYASIAVDSWGNLLAADGSGSHGIWAFRKGVGDDWDTGNQLAVGGSCGGVEFDGNGTPYVISVFIQGNIFAIYHDGNVWQTERVVAGARSGTCIRRDPQGGLGVLYERPEGGIGLARKPAS